MKTGKLLRKIIWIIFLLFILANGIAFMHAWKFTHFSGNGAKPKDPGTVEKMKMVLTGVPNPRPENKDLPGIPFETITIQSGEMKFESWLLRSELNRGTVVVFHGYGGEKSGMMDKADALLSMGYSVMLVDFRGSGGSSGNRTSIGYRESEEVQLFHDYLKKQGEKNIHLMGTSMGAAAILKAVAETGIQPASIIIECPFASLADAVTSRFRMLGVPKYPMMPLLVFWGGVQNGFWAFEHKPAEYAKNVNTATLLLYGAADNRVSREETDEIFKNLKGKKELVVYPLAAHENYLIKYRDEWCRDVNKFLSDPEQKN
jgi:alpha-beta hydrolase superfamily lysophospholipase